MKQAIFALALIVATAGSANTTFAQNDTTRKEHRRGPTAKKYTCPMHPEVVSSKPGKCPKCGMNLELVKTGKKKK